MGNLPEKIQQATVAVAIYNPPPGTKAIAIRRQMVELPEVAKALTPVEKYIFAASTKTQICEMDDGALVEKTAQMFRFIAMDVGFRIPTEQNNWAYMCTRLLDILKKYYSQMTLADIKLSFELATTGELNEFLPKDSQGNPDKNHYQQFNADYFAKILNAYQRKQNEVIFKAYAALPEPKKGIDMEQQRIYRNSIVEQCRNAFLQFKYRNKFNTGLFGDMFVYNWLHAVGLANDIQETDDDRETALSMYLQRAAAGWYNTFEVKHIRQNGTQSREIDYMAFEVARFKEIKKAFTRMVSEELQVDNYLTYWKDEYNND
jgi:hypothetical protein